MKNKIMTTGLKCAVFYCPVLLSLYMYIDDQEDDEVCSLHRLCRSIQRVAKSSFMHKFGLTHMSHIFLATFNNFCLS